MQTQNHELGRNYTWPKYREQVQEDDQVHFCHHYHLWILKNSVGLWHSLLEPWVPVDSSFCLTLLEEKSIKRAQIWKEEENPFLNQINYTITISIWLFTIVNHLCSGRNRDIVLKLSYPLLKLHKYYTEPFNRSILNYIIDREIHPSPLKLCSTAQINTFQFQFLTRQPSYTWTKKPNPKSTQQTLTQAKNASTRWIEAKLPKSKFKISE